MTERTDIKSKTIEELKVLLTDWGEKPFRAGQIFGWLHEKRVASYEEMTNLSKTLRERLDETCRIITLRKEQVQISKLDGTRKYLFLLEDGNVIESVLMKYKHGNSVCISSQAGCRMGCRFCASTIGGLNRCLLPSEMLDQVYRIQTLTGQRVSNVVVMGTGEPLDNYDHLLRFIHLLTGPEGLNISQRSITVSTCGIVPGILRLADENLEITLALSLHASTQEKRESLMPVAKKYEIHEVLNACRYYFEKTGRRVTFEYALVGGVNDGEQDAEQLHRLLGNGNFHINLIPVNPVKERSYVQPDRTAVLAFQKKLEKYGINVTIRREMGRDINGACGQLRRSRLAQKEEQGT